MGFANEIDLYCEEREESNIISRILATEKMEETEGESGLEGHDGHVFRVF